MPLSLPATRRTRQWAMLLSALAAVGIGGFAVLNHIADRGALLLTVSALYAACAGLAVSVLRLWQRQSERTADPPPPRERLESAENIQLALSGAELGLWDLDFQSGRLNLDARGCGMLGYAPGENGHHVGAWQALVHPEDAPTLGAAIEEHLSGRSPSYSVEHRSRHKRGHWVWLLSRAQVTERGADGAPLRMVGTQVDITARKEAESALLRANRQLVQMSHLDALTHLANRRLFHSTLRSEFARGAREMGPLAVLVIDIDHFGAYNERHGNAQGDLALARVARVLRGCVHRSGDLVARIGGEVFGVLLPCTGLAGAQVVAGRCVEAAAQAGIPHGASPAGACITVSVGVASAACDLRDDPMRLLREAEEALHRAKEAGRGRFACAAEQAAATVEPA